MTEMVITSAYVMPAPIGGDGVKTVVGYGTGPTLYEVSGSSIDLTDYFSGTIQNIIMTSADADKDWKFTAGTNYAVRARGTITLTGIATADDTFVVNATTFTAKATADAGDDIDYFDIGAGTAAEQVLHMVETLNEGSECLNLKAWDGTGDTVVIEWTIAGATTGSLITFTESLDNATIDGAGTLIGPTIMGTDANGSEQAAVNLSAIVTQFVAEGTDQAVT